MRATIVIGLNVALVVAVMATTGLTPKADAPVAVAVSPFAEAGAAALVVAAAGGALLRGGPAGWIMLARSDDPDFVEKLYQSGALVVLNAAGGAGCPPSWIQR